MVNKIEVRFKYEDTRASSLLKKLNSHLSSHKLTALSLIDAYTIEKELEPSELRQISSMLTNPVIQESVNYPASSPASPDQAGFDWALEIGFLPGVTDNVANTTKEGIRDLIGQDFSQNEGVYTSQIVLLSGDLETADLDLIAGVLANPAIQRVHRKSQQDFAADGGMDVVVPKVLLTKEPSVTEVDLDVGDEELVRIGKEGIANPDGSRRGPMALSLEYMKAIQEHFRGLGRKPTDLEIESIAQTWSEHCKHTIFADPIDEIKDGLYKAYIKAATKKISETKDRDLSVSVFIDNSGAFEFDDDYLVTHKVETHNSPSALDPFGGAITGIVGVNRDAMGFGLGAKPIVNVYGFCLVDPRDTNPIYRDKEGKNPMLAPEKIMTGVIEGVNSGGNQSGIPSPQGFLYFHKRFKGKPLVFAGTVGLIPKKLPDGRLSHLKKANPGDYIVMLGGRVGLDGIHGATFSSVVLDEGSPAAAVQIGDPITQKKFSDALIKEARDRGLYSSITDNGAGGISCSVAEMARESGGFRLELEKVPLKYPGLEPWQIWISESQERMTLAVPPEKWSELQELLKRRGVEATVLGEFNDSGRCVITYNGMSAMDLDIKFLHDGLPQRQLTTKIAPSQSKEPAVLKDLDGAKTLHQMLARLNLASTAFVSSQYDHEVQGGSVLKPLQGRGMVNADATVVQPRLDSYRALALSQALYPSYTEIDPYAMAACAIDTAIRNLVTTGADPETISILDNFCWCSSDDPERLGQLKLATKACYDYAVAYETPFISGKDSMFNDFSGFDAQHKPIKISALPTLLISSIGILPDARQAVSIDFKVPGDHVYLLGETHEEMGGSEFFAYLGGDSDADMGLRVPQVEAAANRLLYQGVYALIKSGLLASSISVGRGGLAIALARSAMAGGLGATIAIEDLKGGFETSLGALYSESQGRILVSINPQKKAEFESQASKMGSVSFLGQVAQDSQFEIAGHVSTDVAKLLQSYRSTFGGF